MRIKGCITVNDTGNVNIKCISGINLKSFKDEMKFAKNNKEIVSVDILSNISRFSKPYSYNYGPAQTVTWFDSYRAPEYDKSGCSDFIIIPPQFELYNPVIEISADNPLYSYHSELIKYKTAIITIDNWRVFIPYDNNFLESVLSKCYNIQNVSYCNRINTLLSIDGTLTIDNNVLNCKS